MPAANFDAAAGVASLAVQDIFQSVGSLRTKAQQWVFALASNLDPDDANERTVLNWAAPFDELIGVLPTNLFFQTQVIANFFSTLLWRTCKAIYYAGVDGRISSAQTTGLLAAFNTIFPT